MVSDQGVLCRIHTPQRLSGRFASYSHRGVNEKQPLRGIYFIARNMYFHEGFIASERLFLDNPTMGGTAPAGSGLRGDGQELYDLVGDHVSVLSVHHDVTLVSLRRATWSPTKLCNDGYTPHEGCQDASLPTAIVGLMRNNLSEVSTSLSVSCPDNV